MASQGNKITDFTDFQSMGLINVDQVAFSKKNLIIGKNGSGKTRFLKALEQEKKKKDKKDIVITLYFPEIQSFYNANPLSPQEDATQEASQEIFPYDLLLENENNSFYDFLKIMENDKGDFLEDILKVLSLKRTRKTSEAKRIFSELNELLFEFLGKKICMEQDEDKIYIDKAEDDINIRHLPLVEALSEFSPGELMLFYLCVFLMAVKQKPADSVTLIIDEPELHLHPRALVKTTKMLMDFESVSELWIASHSLFLVPLFSFEELIFMHQSQVFSRNSQTYEKLYDSLVGLENTDVFEFLKSIDDWQYYQFIVECFCLPESVGKVDVNDEQFCKLLSSVKKNMKSEPIQMLDYGAGKYRIWECMQLLPDSEPGKNNVIYTAYEPYPEDGDKDNKPFKLYTKFEDIYDDILAGKQKFHVVVLMNVLHEIEIKKWKQTFDDIYDILADGGVLIFLEVLSLAKGEQPYGSNGYLVLQDEQVKILFNDSNIANTRKNPKEKSNCWMITKEQVGNVSPQTIKDSLESLKNCSYNALRKEYKKRIEYAHQQNDISEKQIAARKYAFLSQQYINAILALEFLEQSVYNPKKRPAIITVKENECVLLPSSIKVQPIEVVGMKKPPNK